MPPPERVDASAGAGAEAQAEAARLDGYGVLRLRAPNPGLLTLSGTNTWVVGRGPAWVIDPGPLIDSHLAALLDAIDARGGLGGVALTHDHHDHAEAVAALLERHPAPLASGRGGGGVTLAEGERFGPFEAVATPGHSVDHFALLAGRVLFSGDSVLGEGSVFIDADPGAMSGYLAALERLAARAELEVICPGHGPVVWDAHAKLEQYIAHRLDREQRLLSALAGGARSVDEMLDGAWPEVPVSLRPAAALSLAAHLDKLEEEQLLPSGVERPRYRSPR